MIQSITQSATLPVRHPIGLSEMRGLSTAALRDAFLIPSLFVAGQVQATYTHYDRMIVGGAAPVHGPLTLPTYDNLKSNTFLARRELGIINLGEPGSVIADGTRYDLEKLDGLYLGMGTADVTFESYDTKQPALFYLLSAPAHAPYPTRRMTGPEAQPTRVGSRQTANERTIYKYIHRGDGPAGGIVSCQLVMGLTVLEPGSVWNTMPVHVHDRRMEVYCYFDVQPDQRVLHLMGPPDETRHLLVANHEAVVSPPWSIHSGCGTAHYSFVWGMAGENIDYADMDIVAITEPR